MQLRTPSPATALAGIALFLALGGTALAARHYLITSTHQIKPSVLKELHGARGATGPQGPGGPAGGPGPQGAQGARGEAGPSNLSALTIVHAADEVVPVKEIGESVATCPSGMHVISGGGYTGFAVVNDSQMSSDHQSWMVLVTNGTVIATNLEAIAYCAGTGQAVAASVPSAAHARALRQIHALAARLRQERQALKNRQGEP